MSIENLRAMMSISVSKDYSRVSFDIKDVRKAFEEITGLESDIKQLRGVLTGAHEYLDKGRKIECGCKWHGDAEIALENTKPKD